MSNHELPFDAATTIFCYLILGRIEGVKGMFVQVAVGTDLAVASEGVVTAKCNIDLECFVKVSR